eukprot:TRINITY_DN5008_c0_g1_i1.p1 TRINITY_DN5008_c0_g1~~TRINITY_DN5008_c0_g1_i1.p1  ORF type:complete len:951 (+),score=308.56 TRINITY_DN5008_c0_g1_i1:75-2927(+)
MADYKKAKNFKEAHKAAMAGNLPGGVMTMQVMSCKDLPKADRTGKIDAQIKVLFSTLENQQVAKTEVVKQDRNPKYDNGRFEFNICKAADVVTFELYDQDYFPFPKSELIAKCRMDVGEGSKFGSDGDVTLHFRSPKASSEGMDGYVSDKYGTVTVRIRYDFQEDANVHASEDITYKNEDEDKGFLELVKILTDELLRISCNSGYCLTPLWYFLDTCMWTRPFESAFWLLFWTLSVFVFDNMLSAFIPGCLFICLVRQYQFLRTYGFKGPPQAPYPPPPPMKTLLVNTIYSLRMCNDYIEMWFAIYAWKMPDTAMLLTKGCLAWFLAIMFFPLMPAMRYWFWITILYMYTLYPLYFKYPRLMSKHIEMATDLADKCSVANLERNVYPLLPAAVHPYLPASEDTKMEKEVDELLPPIPDGPLAYQDWRRYYEEREQVKGMLELHRAGYVTADGVPKLPQDGLKGKLHVRLISSQGFKQDDGGTADPYANLTVETKTHKSKTVTSTMAPVWNAEFTFREVTYLSDPMSIMIADWNRFSGDRLLGNTRMPLDVVAQDVPKVLDLPLTLPGRRVGEGEATVSVSVRGTGPGWPSMRHSTLLQRIQKLRRAAKEAASSGPSDQRTGTLHVTLVSGQGLKVCDARTSDPYVLLSIASRDGHPTDSKPMKSSVKESTLSPTWNEKFTIARVNSTNALQVRVFDSDSWGSDDPMGSGTVGLDDIFEGDVEKRTVDLKLSGKMFGMLHLRLTAEGFGRRVPETKGITPAKIEAWAAERKAQREQSPSPSPPRGQVGVKSPPAGTPAQATPAKGVLNSPESVGVTSPAGDAPSLEVTILSARSLSSARSSPEYYVKAQLIDRATKAAKKFKTRPVAPGTTNPQWNVAFVFKDLHEATLRTHQLQLEVWDAQGTHPEAAGVCDVANSMAGHEAVEAWLKVFHAGKEAGEVRIKLRARGFVA